MTICKCCGRGSSGSESDPERLLNQNSSHSTVNNNYDPEKLSASVSANSEEENGPGIKKWIKEFADNTTMHGLSHMLAGNCCAKIFWLAIMIVMLSVGIYQVQELVANFISSPTLTSIGVQYPHGLKFPELTICILSKLNGTRLKEMYPFMRRDVAEFSTASFISAYGTALLDLGYFQQKNKSVEEVTEYLQQQLDKELGGQDILDFFEDVTFTCEGQFLVCWFENGDMFNCCDPKRNLRIKRFLLHSGPCYKFHFEDQVEQRLPGPVGGFGFVYWYPNNDIVNSVFNAYDEHGVHLYTAPSNAMLEKNPVALPVGSHIHITMQGTKNSRLKYDAVGRQVCFEKKLKYFDLYDYPACQAECLIDNMFNLCNCTGLTTYANLPRDRYCTPRQAFDCFNTYAMNFTYLLTKCRLDRCTEACEYWTYRPSITVGKVFNPALQQKMVEYWRLPNTSDPSQSLIIADVYFDDIQFMEIKQVNALTVEGFISQIGGAMGLWTGASIITWIHLVYYCSAHCCMTRKKKAAKVREVKRRKKRAVRLLQLNKNPHGGRNSIPQNEFIKNNPSHGYSSSEEADSRRHTPTRKELRDFP